MSIFNGQKNIYDAKLLRSRSAVNDVTANSSFSDAAFTIDARESGGRRVIEREVGEGLNNKIIRSDSDRFANLPAEARGTFFLYLAIRLEITGKICNDFSLSLSSC